MAFVNAARKTVVLLFVFSSFISPAQDTRPNIIYIMADDMGYADLSCYGRKDYVTPRLDRLASEGVLFTRAYATAPVCTPTRVSFFTGRYPARVETGLREPLDWTTEDSLIGLSPETPSVATQLRNHGYETYLVGKWHLGFKPAFGPRRNGFDYFFGFHAGAFDYRSHSDPEGKNDLYENETPVQRDGYATDLWRDKAIEIIRKSHSKPFFLVLMFNAPHWPWQAPGDEAYPAGKPWRSGGSKEIYGAMVRSMDTAVGAILDALKEQKISDNTLVIFTSDNGGEQFSDMGPYRGKKMTLLEGGLREPAFMRWPSRIPAGKQCSEPVITMDFTATIFAAAGVAPNTGFPLDGMNILPYCITNKKEVERRFFWRISERNQQKAMLQGHWKWLQDSNGAYLFDLDRDPGEQHDLKLEKPQLFDALKKLYAEWELTMLPPLPLISGTPK